MRLVILTLVGAVAFCALAAPAQAKEEHVVIVKANQFEPADITIIRGDLVRWVWEAGENTITSGLSSNPEDKPGELWDATVDEGAPLFELTFDEKGSFPYFSRTNEGTMRGTITVLDEVPTRHQTWSTIKRVFERSGASFD